VCGDCTSSLVLCDAFVVVPDVYMYIRPAGQQAAIAAVSMARRMRASGPSCSLFHRSTAITAAVMKIASAASYQYYLRRKPKGGEPRRQEAGGMH
jgi:hypothetical protein